MATNKEIEIWLSYLKKTKHFESVFSRVFGRIVEGEGHGLIIIQGPPKANKSFFLNVVKAFQKGVSYNAKEYFSSDLQRLLAKVDISHYQCVDIKADCPTGASSLYTLPLYLTIPLSLASAAQKRGMKKGHRTVVLCDDLQEFLRLEEPKQIIFFNQVSGLICDYKELTFLGAYRLDQNGKGLENTALSDYVSPLGYDYPRTAPPC